jgi:hypothetical protein
LTLSRKQAEARSNPVRRRLRHQPHCTPLEDRCLLSVSLTDSAPAVHYVGSPVVLTAASHGNGGAPVYQFSVAQKGNPFHVVSDFSPSNTITWNPMQQGTFQIRAVVKPGFGSRRVQSATMTYVTHTRVVNNSPVVSPTANPLVALFSAPPSPGTSMYVQFAQQSASPSWQNTSALPIVRGKSTNFIVAGMLPDTTYLMRYVLNNGTASAPVSFTTGTPPASLHLPTFTVVQPPAAGTDLSQSVIFHAGLFDTVATDLNGNVIWYYDRIANNFTGYAPNLEPGGTVMLLGGKPSTAVQGGYDTLRQVDLAGNTLRQTNVSAINAQLAALHKSKILDLDHEAKLLPNGDTVVLAGSQKTVNYQGKSTNFIGNMVLVLDQNFHVVWTWNAFNGLDTNRVGTDPPNPSDWLHANSVSWSPADKDLIVSLRAQDWVVKINYNNGKGNGHVVWKLGAGGDFTPIANTPEPWFTHQHDARYINNNTLLVFDDGNTRHDADGSGNSRGQEWILNEQNKTATLVVNADLGNYSVAFGSAQMLPNGNLAFNSGALGTPPTHLAGQTIEVLPNGTTVFVQQESEWEYRSYFVTSLYSASLLGD